MGLLATSLCDGTDSELDAESNGHLDMIKDLNSFYRRFSLLSTPPN